MTPPDVLVWLLERDVDSEPGPPGDEDDDVRDPAEAVTCDPVTALLDASAEQSVIGAAAAVPSDAVAAIARAATPLAVSANRVLLSHENMVAPPSAVIDDSATPLEESTP